MYTTNEEYNAYFNTTTTIDDYDLLEDMAVLYLSDYSLYFPTMQEWLDFETISKEYIKKSIFWEIRHLNENRSLFTSASSGINNVKLGNYSYQVEPDKNGASVDMNKLNENAILYLQKSGIVVTNLGKCCSYQFH
jgi:hypothetical protein